MNSTTQQSALIAERIKNDPRVLEAKRLILEAVNEHRSAITQISEADPNLKVDYDAMLAAFGKIRGGNLYFPYLASGVGNGPFVELADGSVKLDFITGIGVHGFGHSDPRLIRAGIDAALADTVMQGNLQQGTISYEFAKLLVSLARESGSNIEHCFLSTSGAMANENALKIAFQKHFPAKRVLAFDHCFAGRTLALAQVTDKAAYRIGLPETIAVDYLPFFDQKNAQESTRRTIQVMRELLHRHPNDYACLWTELIQGEGGYYVGSREYFRAVFSEAKKHNMAIIADEVQTFCRTSRPYAFQHFGLDSLVDIVTVGKISQACATLFTPDYNPKPGLISQTFTASSWAIHAGLVILKELQAGGNFGDDGKNLQLHAHFVAGLENLANKYPGSVLGPFGVGGMVAFTAFDGSMKTAKDLVNIFYENGLMSFSAGGQPTRIRFLMPLGVTEPDHIDLAIEIMDKSFARWLEVSGQTKK